VARSKNNRDVITYQVYRLRRAASEEELEDLPLHDIFIMEPVEDEVYRTQSQAVTAMRMGQFHSGYTEAFVLRPQAQTLEEAEEAERNRERKQRERAGG
jgi:hypothetical protein